MIQPLLTSEQRARIEHHLKNSQHFVLCGHTTPDGDAVGSTVGLWHYLRALGKEVTVVLPNGFPDFLKWIPGADGIVLFDKQPEQATALLQQAEVVVCLDLNETSRLEQLQQAVQQSPAEHWMFDHHLHPSDEFELQVSYPNLSSTCELVFRIIQELGGFELLSLEGTQALYAGMCTDTGGFTYNSSRPEIFYIIGDMLKKGIDKDKIFRNLYYNNSFNRIRLEGYVRNQKYRLYEAYGAALYTLNDEEQQQYAYQKGDTEGLVNVGLTIQGINLSCSLREDKEKGCVLVSLRSVDDIPCNLMAAEFFNGGGHRNASGGRFYGTLDEAVAQFERAIERYKEWLMPVK